MRERNQKHSVCLVIRKSERGISLVTTLFALTTLFITLPLIPLIINTLDYEPNYDDFSTRQFFHFLNREFHSALTYSTNNSKLYIEKENGETVIIDQYKNLIRRQVNNQGHEILLRDISKFTVQSTSFGVYLVITSSKGNVYEKAVSIYD